MQKRHKVTVSEDDKVWLLERQYLFAFYSYSKSPRPMETPRKKSANERGIQFSYFNKCC